MSVVHFGQLSNPSSPTAFTPTITPASGAITSYSASAEYLKVDKRVTVSITATITNNGTGAGYLNISGLPVNSDSFEHIGVGINGTSAKQLVAYMSPGTTNIYIRLYDSTYPVVSGDTIFVTITYLSTN